VKPKKKRGHEQQGIIYKTRESSCATHETGMKKDWHILHREGVMQEAEEESRNYKVVFSLAASERIMMLLENFFVSCVEQCIWQWKTKETWHMWGGGGVLNSILNTIAALQSWQSVCFWGERNRDGERERVEEGLILDR
jgi:hypothetical protein